MSRGRSIHGWKPVLAFAVLALPVTAWPQAAAVRAAVPREPSPLSQQAGCTPQWVQSFGRPSALDGEIKAFAVFDGGGGPALHAGGTFTGAADGEVILQHVARWDGLGWQPLGAGLDGAVHSLAVFDDGNGPALYAGGEFTRHLVRWTGSDWIPVGVGVQDTVRALCVFDDGSGPALYAGGDFGAAGGVPAQHVARWDGATWSPLGSGADAPVSALSAFGPEDGAVLVAGGDFIEAGGMPAQRVAAWDGSRWSPLGAGCDGPVRSLAVFDDGGGSDLYAGGLFTTAGGSAAGNIARWDGASWSPLDGGVGGAVLALEVFEEDSVPALYVGGSFTTAGAVAASNVARFDGVAWSALGGGVPAAVQALEVAGARGEPALHAGGLHDRVWDGDAWRPFGSGLDGWVHALALFDDGQGPAVFVGGSFESAGATILHNIGRWDGTGWSALGSDPEVGVSGDVTALAVFDDGRGEALFVGGSFVTAGGVTAHSIARWDGVSWSAVGGGVGGPLPDVLALEVFDDGSGPALHAGGRFTTAGGLLVNRVARWDGDAWSALGSLPDIGIAGNVLALAGFDDGNGPALFAAGQFVEAGGIAVLNVARWDGVAWSKPTNLGINGPIHDLESYDDGSGPVLYGVGSGFASIFRWDGTNALVDESPLVEKALALEVFDDGGGPELHVAGYRLSPFGEWEGRIVAKADNDDEWSLVQHTGFGSVGARALLAVDEGDTSSLLAGGSFFSSPAGDSYLARRQGCPHPPEYWANLLGGTAGHEGIPELEMSGALTPLSTLELDLVAGVPFSPAVLFVSLTSRPAPFLGGVLHALPFDHIAVFVTDAFGKVQGATTWPGGPPGLSVFLQFAIVDQDVPVFGASLSNAVTNSVP